jgi:hypothetical protein
MTANIFKKLIGFALVLGAAAAGLNAGLFMQSLLVHYFAACDVWTHDECMLLALATSIAPTSTGFFATGITWVLVFERKWLTDVLGSSRAPSSRKW